MILRPAFGLITAFLSFFRYYCFFALGGTLLVGGAGGVVFELMGIPFFYSFGLAAIAFLPGPLLPFLFWLKILYSRLEYVVTGQSLEYPGGILVPEKKLLNLKDIHRITVRQNYFQKSSGIGTIFIWAETRADRVRIPDIADPDGARIRMLDQVGRSKKVETGDAVQ